MEVVYIILSSDEISLNGETYPLRDYVISANGAEISPRNVPGWFFAAVNRSKVVLDKSVLHNATLSLVQI